MIKALISLWAVRPRGPRALARIQRRNAADPRVWDEFGSAIHVALKGAFRG